MNHVLIPLAFHNALSNILSPSTFSFGKCFLSLVRLGPKLITTRPALRDRLIANDHDYFAPTSDFSDSFRRNYKFNWPFPFEDAYVYDRQANTYRISPIFERYHKNIRYWGVQKPFFERFPELVHDIVCHDDDDGPVPRIQAVDTMAEGGGSTADKIFSGMFTEGELTELFNDYPQLA